MKKLFVIAMMLDLALNVNAQDVYSVGYYNIGGGYNAALYKNGERLYTAHHYNQTSKATRVTCNSQGDVYWWINFYDYPSNEYSHSELRINNQIYASTENHSEVHVSDIYCLNDTLYYTGYQYNEDSICVATVWKGDDFTTHWVFGDGVHPSLIYNVDIDKQTGIPYFCGYIIDGKKKASVWREQELLFTNNQDTINGSYITYTHATQIAVGNGHVYTIGEFEPEGWSGISAIWKDNEMLGYGGLYEYTYHAVCALDNSFYSACSNRWFDDISKDFQTEMLRIGYAYKLFSSNTNIYVIGKDSDYNFYIWRNFEKVCQIEDCNGLFDACVFDPFISPNSEWYYEIENEDGSITYQHLEYSADTTIGSQRPKIIIRSNTQYDRDTLFTTVTHEYVYEKNGKVYWWNKDLEEFTTLYDFAAGAGDAWEIKVGMESFTVHVDSVGIFEYDGENRKILHISDIDNIFNGDIVVGYGHMTSFFPEKLMNRNTNFTVNGLRCYWVNDVLVYHNDEEDCDAIYGEIHGIEEDGPSTGSGTFTVYPNPANGILFVETRFIASQPTAYRIINLMGQTLLQGNITAETQQIDISSLPSGMYFISVGEGTVKFVVR